MPWKCRYPAVGSKKYRSNLNVNFDVNCRPLATPSAYSDDLTYTRSHQKRTSLANVQTNGTETSVSIQSSKFVDIAFFCDAYIESMEIK